MGILEDAVELIGKVDYQFGANDIPGGVGDCSAFTQYVYKQNDYVIGRNTIAQSNAGIEVKREALLPGDLVFLQGTNPDRAGVSHVGIYAGSGKVIHLSSYADTVVVDDINSEYWKEHWYTARRVASQEDVGTAIVPAVGETTGGSKSGGTDYDNSISAVVSGSLGLGLLGDIIVIVLIIACVLLGVFFVFKAFSAQIPLPSLDDIGDAINKVKPKGE